MELTPIVELGVAEAYAILADRFEQTDLPPLDAIENEDWGRDWLLSRFESISEQALAGAGLTRDEGWDWAPGSTMNERLIRPDPRLALSLTILVVGGLWLGMGVFIAYAAWFLPEHLILKDSFQQSLDGMMLLSAIFATPFRLGWLIVCRTSWKVGPAGIAVLRGRTAVRDLSWSEIRGLRFPPTQVALDAASRPWREDLYFLSRADAAWLRAVDQERRHGRGPSVALGN